MVTSGIVSGFNTRRGMVAIETEHDGYTIVEVSGGDEFALGDTVEWSSGTGCASQIYRNVTKGVDVMVFVQNHWVPRHQVRQQLLLEVQ